jgi:hypothetical protein
VPGTNIVAGGLAKRSFQSVRRRRRCRRTVLSGQDRQHKGARAGVHDSAPHKPPAAPLRADPRSDRTICAGPPAHADWPEQSGPEKGASVCKIGRSSMAAVHPAIPPDAGDGIGGTVYGMC